MADLCKHGAKPCEACAYERGQQAELNRCLNIVLTEPPPKGPMPEELRVEFERMGMQAAHEVTLKVAKEAIARRILDPFEGVTVPAGDGKNLIDDAMKRAAHVSGCAWPSADGTRWALQELAKSVASHAAANYHSRVGGNVLRDELLRVCGLWKR